MLDPLTWWRRLWSGRLNRLKLRPEEQLTIAAADLLRLRLPRDAFFFHPANEALRSKASWAVQQAMGFMRGLPDLVIVYRGKVCFIELKVDGRLTEHQEAFRELCDLLQIPWACCRSANDVDSILLKWSIVGSLRVAAA